MLAMHMIPKASDRRRRWCHRRRLSFCEMHMANGLTGLLADPNARLCFSRQTFLHDSTSSTLRAPRLLLLP